MPRPEVDLRKTQLKMSCVKCGRVKYYSEYYVKLKWSDRDYYCGHCSSRGKPRKLRKSRTPDQGEGN